MIKRTIHLIAIIGLMAASPAVFGQVLNTNGDFEGSWTTVVPGGSTPALGKPTGWSSSYTQGVGQYQVGGTYAALMIGSAANTGTSSGNLNTSPNFSSPPTTFVTKFDVALGASTGTNSAANTGNNRLFQMYLNNGAGQLTNLIITQGTTASKANVGLYSSGGWIALSSLDALTTSGAYDFATNGFANALTFYTFTITVHDFTLTGVETKDTSLSYDISCDLRGGGNIFNLTGLTGAFGTPNTTGLSSVTFTSGFAGATTGTSFLVDNVSVTAIPEPTSLALMAGGLLLLGTRRLRCKRS